MNEEEFIVGSKNILQAGLLFDNNEGFDKKNFRNKCNPEVDYDDVKNIIDEVRRQERKDLRFIIKITEEGTENEEEEERFQEIKEMSKRTLLTGDLKQ